MFLLKIKYLCLYNITNMEVKIKYCLTILLSILPIIGFAKNNKIHKNEVVLSISAYPTLAASKEFNRYIDPKNEALDLQQTYEQSHTNVNFLPYVAVEYSYRIKDWLHVGSNQGLLRVTADVYDPLKASIIGQKKYTQISVLPHVRFTYLPKEHFKVYSTISLGCNYTFGENLGQKVSKFNIAYELVPIGLSFGGEQIYGTSELVIGSTVLGLRLGLGFRF